MPDKHDKTRDKDGRWKSGSSGNPNGRPKGTSVTDILKEFAENVSVKDSKSTLLQDVVKKVFELALNGNMKAIEFITERLEGRVSVREDDSWKIRPFDRIIFNECDIEGCHCKENAITLDN